MTESITLKLTARNNAAIARCADLVGLTVEEVLNDAFVKKFLLSRFADPRSGRG
jgi:hypothetical protein